MGARYGFTFPTRPQRRPQHDAKPPCTNCGGMGFTYHDVAGRLIARACPKC